MAEHDHVRGLARNSRLDLLGQSLWVHDVMHQKFPASQGDRFGYPVIQSWIIRVARHCRHRSYHFQFQNDPRQPDVPTVQNVVHPSEERGDLRVYKIVRVGNDADFDDET